MVASTCECGEVRVCDFVFFWLWWVWPRGVLCVYWTYWCVYLFLFFFQCDQIVGSDWVWSDPNTIRSDWQKIIWSDYSLNSHLIWVWNIHIESGCVICPPLIISLYRFVSFWEFYQSISLAAWVWFSMIKSFIIMVNKKITLIGGVMLYQSVLQ